MLAGSTLSGFGSVEPIWRLILAIAGALAGLVALGSIFWRSVDVVAPRRFPLRALADDRIVPLRVRRRIEAEVARLFPRGVGGYEDAVPGFAELQVAIDTAEERLRRPDSPDNEEKKEAARVELKRIADALVLLLKAASFEELRLRFLKLKDAVFIGGFIAAIGFGAFAWAISPPREPGLLKPPFFRTIKVDPQDLKLLKDEWTDPKCLTVELELIEIRIRPSGISDVVTVPNNTCPPVLFELHMGRLSKS